jgi:ribonuclease HI
LKARSIAGSEVISEIAELTSLCNNSAYWRNKKKPLLVLVHLELFSIPIHQSRSLEMFSLSTWMTNIDIKRQINLNIDNVEGPKKAYSVGSLLQECIKTLNKKYSGFCHLYTDGSKVGEAVGAAFYDPYSDVKAAFKLNDKTSVMAAELYAIAECLSYVKSCVGTNFVVLIDSKSALQHLARCTSGNRGHPVAYVILNLYLQLQSNGKNIKFQWVPSHINLTGNEEVDKLAKMGVDEGISVNHMPFFTDLLREVKGTCFKIWKEYFNERSKVKGIWYKTIVNEPPKVPWFCDGQLNRPLVVTSMRLRSGHMPLNVFGHLMRVVDSPDCCICHVREDTYHALVECARIGAERRAFEEQSNLKLTDVGSCSILLSNPTSKLAIKLYNLIIKLVKCRQ